jgi:hypothetical protein
MLSMLLSGRYVLLLMALFSIYVGAIYNEAFSLPILPSPSAFALNHSDASATRTGNIFHFGVDPVRVVGSVSHPHRPGRGPVPPTPSLFTTRSK